MYLLLIALFSIFGAQFLALCEEKLEALSDKMMCYNDTKFRVGCSNGAGTPSKLRVQYTYNWNKGFDLYEKENVNYSLAYGWARPEPAGAFGPDYYVSLYEIGQMCRFTVIPTNTRDAGWKQFFIKLEGQCQGRGRMCKTEVELVSRKGYFPGQGFTLLCPEDNIMICHNATIFRVGCSNGRGTPSSLRVEISYNWNKGFDLFEKENVNYSIAYGRAHSVSGFGPVYNFTFYKTGQMCKIPRIPKATREAGFKQYFIKLEGRCQGRERMCKTEVEMVSRNYVHPKQGFTLVCPEDNMVMELSDTMICHNTTTFRVGCSNGPGTPSSLRVEFSYNWNKGFDLFEKENVNYSIAYGRAHPVSGFGPEYDVSSYKTGQMCKIPRIPKATREAGFKQYFIKLEGRCQGRERMCKTEVEMVSRNYVHPKQGFTLVCPEDNMVMELSDTMICHNTTTFRVGCSNGPGTPSSLRVEFSYNWNKGFDLFEKENVNYSIAYGRAHPVSGFGPEYDVSSYKTGQMCKIPRIPKATREAGFKQYFIKLEGRCQGRERVCKAEVEMVSRNYAHPEQGFTLVCTEDKTE